MEKERAAKIAAKKAKAAAEAAAAAKAKAKAKKAGAAAPAKAARAKRPAAGGIAGKKKRAKVARVAGAAEVEDEDEAAGTGAGAGEGAGADGSGSLVVLKPSEKTVSAGVQSVKARMPRVTSSRAKVPTSRSVQMEMVRLGSAHSVTLGVPAGFEGKLVNAGSLGASIAAASSEGMASMASNAFAAFMGPATITLKSDGSEAEGAECVFVFTLYRCAGGVGEDDDEVIDLTGSSDEEEEDGEEDDEGEEEEEEAAHAAAATLSGAGRRPRRSPAAGSPERILRSATQK